MADFKKFDLTKHVPITYGNSAQIARIVDRDTPPDNRDEVVDWDVTGTPITRGDLARINAIPPKDRK